MRFEDALKAMREGKYASLNGRDFRIEDFGVDGLEILEENVLDEENDFWYWSSATLEAYDIMSEDWEIV